MGNLCTSFIALSSPSNWNVRSCILWWNWLGNWMWRWDATSCGRACKLTTDRALCALLADFFWTEDTGGTGLASAQTCAILIMPLQEWPNLVRTAPSEHSILPSGAPLVHRRGCSTCSVKDFFHSGNSKNQKCWWNTTQSFDRENFQGFHY